MKIVHKHSIPEIGVSHNPDIKKQVVLQNGEIPHVTTLAFASFQPGQRVEDHVHETMYEVFHITSGKAIFRSNDEEFTVTEGDCIVIEPGELHSQYNPFEHAVSWIYFGIATDS